MKKLLLTLIVALGMCGSSFAQYTSNWSGFNGNMFPFQGALVATIMIDGEIIDTDAPNWDALEVAAFVGEECRGNDMYMSDEYVNSMGDPYPSLMAAPIYYSNGGEEVTFMMYDHLNEVLYETCVVLYNNEPLVIHTGEEHFEGWDDPYDMIFLNFTASSTGCAKIFVDADHNWPWDFEDVTATPDDYFTFEKPECWTVGQEYFHGSEVWAALGGVDTLPQVYYSPATDNHSLCMYYRALVALPELDERVEMSRLRLSMDVLQTYPFYKLEIGVMEDPYDESTYEAVALVNNSVSMERVHFECGFTNCTHPEYRYIVFKNVGGSTIDPYSTNFIDDIILSYADELECTKALRYEEDFEGITNSKGDMGIEPDCWTLIPEEDVELSRANQPQLTYSAATNNYSLRMINRCVYAMPVLNMATPATEGLDNASVKLTFDLLQPKSIYRLQVGIVGEDNVFNAVKEINNISTTEPEEVTVYFNSEDLMENRIAFRNVLQGGLSYDYSYNYIDNIVVDFGSQICAGIDETYSEDFQRYTQAGIQPDCWEVIDDSEAPLTYKTMPQVYYSAATSNYSLSMVNRCVYAMPEFVQGVNVSDLTMTFDLLQPRSIYKLEVGLVDEEGEFQMLKTFSVPSNTRTTVSINFGDYDNLEGNRIAFHNVLAGTLTYDYSYNYIDDISFSNNANSEKATDGNAFDADAMESYLDNIAVYPNPTTGVLHINAVDVQKVECYNQMGQLVGVYDYNEIDLGNLAEGVYTLRITVPQGVTLRKVVKR